MIVLRAFLELSAQKNVSVKEMSRGILYVGVMKEGGRSSSHPSIPSLVYVPKEDSTIYHYFPDCTRRTMSLQVEVEDGMRCCKGCERRRGSNEEVISDGESMCDTDILTLRCLERGIIYQVSIALED